MPQIKHIENTKINRVINSLLKTLITLNGMLIISSHCLDAKRD
jgi:uncharacterized protein (DUF1919 family)